MDENHPLLFNARKNFTLDSSPDTFPESNCLHGDTLIMDEEGNLYTLEDLASEYQSEVTVACLDERNRLTTSLAHSFRIGQWSDKIYNVTLSNGHKIKTTAKHPFLGTSGEWILAEDLSFGTALSSTIYDPCKRNPTLSFNEVTHVHIEKLEQKIPMYDFTVDEYENLFIAQQIGETISLIAAHSSDL